MDREMDVARDGAGRPSEGALYAALAYTDRHIKGSDSLGDQIALKAARYAVQKLILAAPSAAGGGEIRGGLVEEAMYPALEVRHVAEALLQRLEGRGLASLVPGGEYLLAGTEAHWLELTRAAIGVVRDAFCAVANRPLASPSQGSDTGEAGRDPFIPGYLNDLCLAGKHPAQAGHKSGAYGIPGMPDRLSNSDGLRIFSAYYADRLPAAACAELVTMADEWDEEVQAARSPAPTAPQGADLAGLLDFGPDLGARTAEPSIRMLARHYYRPHFEGSEVDRLTEAYCSAIKDRIRSSLPLTGENQDRLIITGPGSVRDNGADLAGLSAAATQGELSAPDWGTDFRAGKVPVGMTSPAGDGNGKADRAFIVALWNAYRSGALVPVTSAPPEGFDLRSWYAGWDAANTRWAISAPPASVDREDINPGINASEPRPVEIDYINYRGERGTRRILPNRIIYGATEYHPRHQWLLEAWDLDKGAMRIFALEDMRFLDGDHSGSVAPTSGERSDNALADAFRPADAKDWRRLFLMLDGSGYGRFWQERLRAALAALNAAPPPASRNEGERP